MRVLIGSLLFLFLTACVSVQGLYHDPSFNYYSLKSGNIGVGAVVSAAHLLSSMQQNAYANVLQNSLIERYKGLNVMPAGDTVRAMGPMRYRNMVHYYQRYGVVPTYYLQTMRQHIKRMRYIVFARVIEGQIGHGRDENGGLSRHTSDIRYTTTLSMQVDLAVYDLNQKRIVWSGTVAESSKNANTYTVPNAATHPREDLDKQVVQDVASYAMREQVAQHHTYPMAPSRLSLLKEIFGNLLSKFPATP